MNKKTSTLILPLVASLSLGMGFSTQSLAQAPNTGEASSTQAASATTFTGGQTIYLKSHHDTYAYMADGDFRVGTKRASSKMELVRVGGSGPIKFGDRVALKSVDGSGIYVTAMHAGEQHNAVARATALHGWETFTIINRSGNTPNTVVTADTPFALRGAHNLHMAATPDGQVVASVPHIDDWEMFRLEGYTESIPAIPGENIATKGTATQSSTGWDGVASRAIDGNTDGLYGGGSVTHTNGVPSWWKVALDETYRIDAIRIYNRATAQNRLDKFKVEILKDDAVVQTYGPFDTFSETYFDVPGVNGATGNNVRISIPGMYLSLAEVQIHGTPSPSAPVAQFYIPQSHCTNDVGVLNASAPDIGTLSACDIEVSTEQNTWTATLPGTTMIERIKFSNASHLKDAVVTIEDPDLPEGKRVVFTSEPLNPTGADHFELVDPTYDPDVSEYNWLVFGGVIRIQTTGAGVQDAEISIIQGDATQLRFNTSAAQAALVQDIADTTAFATESEYQASLLVPIEEVQEPVTVSYSISAGNTWTDANGTPLATYSFPPSKTLLPGAEGLEEPKKVVQGSALPNGVEIELYAGDNMILPFTLDKGVQLWDWGKNYHSLSNPVEGLVGVASKEADGLQLGLDHDQVLWKLFHSDEVLKAGTTVYLQGVSGWNYGYHGYQEWAPHGLTDIKRLFSTSAADGSYLGNTISSNDIQWEQPWSLENLKREAGWIIHPVPNTTSVDASGKGEMQFTLQSAADANSYLTLGSMAQITANGGQLNGAYGSVVPKFSVSDGPIQATGATGATVFTMRWENGRTVNAHVDQGLNNFNNEAVTLQNSVQTIKSNISKARITIERMKEMKDLIESTNENIKGARKLTTAVKRVPMIRYVAFPFDRGLKLLERPFNTMDNKLPAKDRLEQLNTLMTSVDAYLTTSNEVLSVLGSEGEKLNVKRTNAFLRDFGGGSQLPDVHTLNACGTAMSIMPGEVYQGLADALTELNGTIDNAGTFEQPPANCDEACMARVTMKNAAATVVLLANNLDNINSALVNARTYVQTINSFASHIRAAGDKVNAGGWMTKTVEFIEDIPVIGWFIKTVRRAVEKYVIDPVMDEAMSLADGLIQPLLAKASLSPETSINDFVNIYNQAVDVKARFDAAKENVNPKAKTKEKMATMSASAAVTAWEDAKGHVYSEAVSAIRTECGLD